MQYQTKIVDERLVVERHTVEKVETVPYNKEAIQSIVNGLDQQIDDLQDRIAELQELKDTVLGHLEQAPEETTVYGDWGNGGDDNLE